MANMSIAIMSGKGGVGKSNITLNLGYLLASHGHPLLLMDCDLGLANLDVLLGVTPEENLQDVLLRGAEVEEAIMPVYKGLDKAFDILAAASGAPELTDMNSDMRDLLINRLEPALANYDLVLMDLGAGIHGTVQSFAGMATVRVVVLTPEPTSLTDSYALIKVLYQELGVKDFLVIVNDVATKKEEEATFERLALACQRFLNVTPVLLGSVRHDLKMHDAVIQQKALVDLFPDSKAAQDLAVIAQRLLRIYESMKPSREGQPMLRSFS